MHLLHINDFYGKRIHMIGIGGSSMSGLAKLLLQRGYTVSGSDHYESDSVRALCDGGIPVSAGHRAENVRDASLVIFSAAIAPDNPERAEATRLQIPQMERSTLLGQLMEGYPRTIAVAGTHGKTTTSAMLARALMDSGLDPSVHLGGSFEYIGGSTRVGHGETFVAEACEFHGSFLQMRPTVAVVLNIEEDHLDYYRDLDDITNAFSQFLSALPRQGVFIGNGDDARVQGLMRSGVCRTVSFGLTEKNEWRAVRLTDNENGCPAFDIVRNGGYAAHISLRVGGLFNVFNALAAMAAACEAGAEPLAVAASLSQFENVHRRFEYTGTIDGVALYHDYGHNPTEMRGALSVAEKRPHNRIWAVMQPHTYSRVKRLFDAYIHCCDAADEILITDIYGAREVDPGDIHSRMLVDAIAQTGQRVHLTPTFHDAEVHLRAHWRPGDLVLTMGCGNINELNTQIRRHGETL